MTCTKSREQSRRSLPEDPAGSALKTHQQLDLVTFQTKRINKNGGDISELRLKPLRSSEYSEFYTSDGKTSGNDEAICQLYKKHLTYNQPEDSQVTGEAAEETETSRETLRIIFSGFKRLKHRHHSH